MSLLMHLPDYVAANRPLDAWIIQHCSYLTGEEPDESNPFLFQMFSYGYDGWVAEQRGREAAMLRELGMDLSRLERMSMEEIDAWLQEQQADPAKLARMEEAPAGESGTTRPGRGQPGTVGARRPQTPGTARRRPSAPFA